MGGIVVMYYFPASLFLCEFSEKRGVANLKVLCLNCAWDLLCPIDGSKWKCASYEHIFQEAMQTFLLPPFVL